MTLSRYAQRFVDEAVANDPWLAAPFTRARGNICRALKIDREDPAAGYATAPFVCLDHGDTTWIAGAVGTTIFDEGHGISDTILWHPPTGRIQILGEAASANVLILPTSSDPELTVYADGFAFFRAWADRRAAYLVRRHQAQAAKHAIIPSEPMDGNLPGALAVGDLDKIHWRDTGATILKAGPGINAKQLQRAVFRSACIPRVVDADDFRRVA